jgi:hypothetical protein
MIFNCLACKCIYDRSCRLIWIRVSTPQLNLVTCRFYFTCGYSCLLENFVIIPKCCIILKHSDAVLVSEYAESCAATALWEYPLSNREVLRSAASHRRQVPSILLIGRAALLQPPKFQEAKAGPPSCVGSKIGTNPLPESKNITMSLCSRLLHLTALNKYVYYSYSYSLLRAQLWDGYPPSPLIPITEPD